MGNEVVVEVSSSDVVGPMKVSLRSKIANEGGDEFCKVSVDQSSHLE